MERNAIAIIVAGALVGSAIVFGALSLGQSLDRNAEQLANLQGSLIELAEAAASAPAAAPAPAQARRRGPDPDRAYRINTANAAASGPADAPVTLIEFSDFQCPFCARVNPTLARVKNEYGDKVRVVFKHLPLSIHPKAPAAHAAAEAARLQGKFWEMHDKIFENQRAMSEENYVTWAGEIGLDVDRFKKDVASPAVKAAVDRDTQEAARLGVTGTPAFFVNGKYLSGARPFTDFKAKIDAALEG